MPERQRGLDVIEFHLAGARHVAAGQIQLDGGGTRDSAGDALTLVDGRTGAGVTAVTIERSDGSSVQATVTNGWYLAWWPGTRRGDERTDHDGLRDQHRGVPVDAGAVDTELPVRGPLCGRLLIRKRKRRVRNRSVDRDS